MFTVDNELFFSAPRVIIYDNACNLHSYCLNREPKFFQNSQFLVDRFHWPNHTGMLSCSQLNQANIYVCICHIRLTIGCSCAYRMNDYPQFIDINSQVVEQSNAALKRIKSSISYMNRNNFFIHCTLFLWYHNKK